MKDIRRQIWAWVRKPIHIIMLIATIIALIVLFRSCKDDNEDRVGKDFTVTKDTVVVTKTLFTMVIDTIRPIPKLVYVDTGSHRIDTIFKKELSDPKRYEELLRKEYENKLNKYVYEDRIKLKDSLGDIFIKDTIQNNKILAREVIPTLRIPEKVTTVTITNTVKEKPRNNVYLGGEVRTNVPVVGSITPEVGLMFQNKQKTIIGATYGYNLSTKSQIVGAKVYIPISGR